MTGTVGLVLRRTARDTQVEPFFHVIAAGLEDAIEARGMRVLTRLVDGLGEELACYRSWAEHGLVSGVVLTNLEPDDPRPAEVRRLGLPAVVLGEPEADTGAAVVRTEEQRPMVDAVEQCAALGHRRIAHVTGPQELIHTQARSRSFGAVIARLGLEGISVEADYSGEGGAEAAMALMQRASPPTAIVFDNDLMAVSAVRVLLAAGYRVPEDVAVIAWDDSLLCRLCDPPLSAMSHDVHGVGVLAGRALLRLLDDGIATDEVAPAAVFVPRSSTALVMAPR